MELTIRMRKLDEKDKNFVMGQGKKYGLRFYETAEETIIRAGGSYNEMASIIIIVSYLGCKEIVLEQEAD